MNNYQLKTNYKYHSINPISRLLVNSFNKRIEKIIKKTKFNNLLDVGCGEGVTLSLLKKHIEHKDCLGIDLDATHIKMSNENAPFCKYKIGNIYDLPLKENSFEMVLCLEVLEHLKSPKKALEQIKKVSSKYIIISVPKEPIWRFLNLTRGKYWKNFGNTPGHLNHWSSRRIKKLANRYFKVIKIYTPLPWTVLLCEIK